MGIMKRLGRVERAVLYSVRHIKFAGPFMILPRREFDAHEHQIASIVLQ